MPGHARSLLFTPDGKTLAVGSIDGKITVWNVATGQQEEILMQHEGAIEHLALHPNGSLLLAVSSDKRYRFWDLSTGAAISEFRPWYDAKKPVNNTFGMEGNVRLSPDGAFYSLIAESGLIEVRRTPLLERSNQMPSWFSEFVESHGGLRLLRENQFEVIPWAERTKTMTRIRDLLGESPLENWVRGILESTKLIPQE